MFFLLKYKCIRYRPNKSCEKMARAPPLKQKKFKQRVVLQNISLLSILTYLSLYWRTLLLRHQAFPLTTLWHHEVWWQYHDVVKTLTSWCITHLPPHYSSSCSSPENVRKVAAAGNRKHQKKFQMLLLRLGSRARVVRYMWFEGPGKYFSIRGFIHNNQNLLSKDSFQRILKCV